MAENKWATVEFSPWNKWSYWALLITGDGAHLVIWGLVDIFRHIHLISTNVVLRFRNDLFQWFQSSSTVASSEDNGSLWFELENMEEELEDLYVSAREKNCRFSNSSRWRNLDQWGISVLIILCKSELTRRVHTTSFMPSLSTAPHPFFGYEQKQKYFIDWKDS